MLYNLFFQVFPLRSRGHSCDRDHVNACEGHY